MSSVVTGLGSIGSISPLPKLSSLQPAEGQSGFGAVLSTALQHLNQLSGGAEQQVAATLQDANEQLKREGDVVATELRAKVDSISSTLASRILGVDITTSVTAAGSGR